MATGQVFELGVPGHNLFVNRIAAAHTRLPGWNGQDVVVSIKEFRFDSTDIDLKGRCLPSSNAAANLSTHANIMASLVGGAGNSNHAGGGAAPGCLLVSSKFEGLMPDTNYSTLQVSTQCHAYGLHINNRYGPGARTYDATTVERPTLLHIFSAGNKGDSFSTDGLYAQLKGFANISGELKMAKNALVVGASDSLGRIFPYSSKGPAHDGRTKPDLVAFGQNGSSESAALVSGAAAVLQQALQESEGKQPDACLVRAILLNNTDDIGPPGPDFESGYGNMNLERALNSVLNHQFSMGTVAAGQTVSRFVHVPANTAWGKVMLAWDEPPANEGAAKALLRDLDLLLISPSGNIFRPWMLNVSPVPDSLRKVAVPGRDSLNNAEQVLVEAPLPGIWEVRIVDSSPYASSQTFAFTWHWESLEHFEWAYPLRKAPAPAGKEVVLYWASSMTEEKAELSWKPCRAGAEWAVITEELPLRRGWWRWKLPEEWTEAQWRVRAGNLYFVSDTVLITPELRVSVGFNCPDSAMLFWNKIEGVERYKLYGLGARYMEPLFETSDTFCVLKKTVFPQTNFAVAPVNAVEGSRSAAPSLISQGLDCYFSSFWGELLEDNTIALHLSIGTVYGLKRILFQKYENTAWHNLGEQTITGLQYTIFDDKAQRGRNRYRCTLHLSNGGVVFSDPVDVYAPGDEAWAIFPNPLSSDNGTLCVLTKEGEGEFSLFDLRGLNIILEYPLEKKMVQLHLNSLPKGAYYYCIKQKDVFISQGKLILH